MISIYLPHRIVKADVKLELFLPTFEWTLGDSVYNDILGGVF